MFEVGASTAPKICTPSRVPLLSASCPKDVSGEPSGSSPMSIAFRFTAVDESTSVCPAIRMRPSASTATAVALSSPLPGATAIESFPSAWNPGSSDPSARRAMIATSLPRSGFCVGLALSPTV